MYKGRGSNKKATELSREEKRRGLRQQNLASRRNIKEDDENVDTANVTAATAVVAPSKKPLSKGVLERQKKLEEYRKAKAQKKEDDKKMKKKPFVVGKVCSTVLT